GRGVDRGREVVVVGLDVEAPGAERDFLSRAEERLTDPLAVDERAVGASLVDDGPVRAAPFDARVLARDRAVRDDDVAGGLATDEGLLLRDLDGSARGRDQSEDGHVAGILA